jgi:hypothetical protein
LCRARRINEIEHGQGFEEVSQEALVGTVTRAMAASDPSRRCRFVLEECVLTFEVRAFPKEHYKNLSQNLLLEAVEKNPKKHV